MGGNYSPLKNIETMNVKNTYVRPVSYSFPSNPFLQLGRVKHNNCADLYASFHSKYNNYFYQIFNILCEDICNRRCCIRLETHRAVIIHFLVPFTVIIAQKLCTNAVSVHFFSYAIILFWWHCRYMIKKPAGFAVGTSQAMHIFQKCSL